MAQSMFSMQEASAESSSAFYPRLVFGSLICVSITLPTLLQPFLTSLYSRLYQSPLYDLSCFETIETILCYAIIEPLYTYKFGKNPHLRLDLRGSKDGFRDDGQHPGKVPRMKRPTKRLGEFIIYAAPLLTMDFIMIKKFAGVSVADIRQSGGYPPPMTRNDTAIISPSFLLPTIHNFSLGSPLQLRRALPSSPPSSRRLILELTASFFIYDTLFFLFHLAIHRIRPLARIHRQHHTHGEVHPQITNRLSIAERLSLVMLANFSLNIIGSHVLTRTLFVPLFVYLLVEVHSGLDLPWGYDKILPWGWGAGSKLHAVHHRTGEGAYAPFFCWWDRVLELLEREIMSSKRK